MVLIWTTFNPDSVTPEKKSFGNTRTLKYLSTGLTSIHPSPSPYTQLGLSRPRCNTLHLLNITMLMLRITCWISLFRHRAAAHNSLLHHAERCCPSRQHNTDGNGQRGFQWQFWLHPLNAISRGVWYQRAPEGERRNPSNGRLWFSSF